jgi:hypothetical protein
MGAPKGRISLAEAGLGGATGGRYPATTWGRYYSMLMAGQPSVGFFPPDETRRGKSVGKVPNEIGGGGSSRRTPRGGGGGGGTPVPQAPAAPNGPTTLGFDGDTAPGAGE